MIRPRRHHGGFGHKLRAGTPPFESKRFSYRYPFSIFTIGGTTVAQSLDDAPGRIESANKRGSLAWRKSTRSVANGQCIETATLPDGRLAVRDSVDKTGPTATFTPSEWSTFVKRIKNGDYEAI